MNDDTHHTIEHHIDAWKTSGSSPPVPPAEYPPALAPVSWMTLAEVAEELRVSTRTVMRWVENGSLPVLVLPGGQKRIHRHAFDLWLTSRLTQPKAAA